MEAEYEDLIRIKQVVDTDVGYYKTGEFCCAFAERDLEKFFKNYGVQGRDELMISITHLIHNIEACFRKLPETVRFPDTGYTGQVARDSHQN